MLPCKHIIEPNITVSSKATHGYYAAPPLTQHPCVTLPPVYDPANKTKKGPYGTLTTTVTGWLARGQENCWRHGVRVFDPQDW